MTRLTRTLYIALTRRTVHGELGYLFERNMALGENEDVWVMELQAAPVGASEGGPIAYVHAAASPEPLVSMRDGCSVAVATVNAALAAAQLLRSLLVAEATMARLVVAVRHVVELHRPGKLSAIARASVAQRVECHAEVIHWS